MDDHEPRKTTTNKRTAAAVVRTPSPSRRRRRRLLTGSSPGCVPRPTGASSASSASASASGSSSSTATTPSRALRTPPPRRLLPPSSASAKRLANSHLTPPPRVARSSATSVLRLDDVAIEDDDGDDSFSIISGDGSPERDRHVMDFLSFHSLSDGTQAFTLFTPSPAASKTSNVTRSIHPELTGGLLTPQASPVRTKKDATSPSQFLRSPYASSRASNSSTTSSPLRFLGRRDKAESSSSSTEEERNDDDVDESELEPEPPRSVTRSPCTPVRNRTATEFSIKCEAIPDAIVCTASDGSRSLSSTPSSSGTAAGAWRRNSLSLMRTPSPAASAKAKALRARAQLLRSTGRNPFAADEEDGLSGSPSALQRGNDQDWLFSFANTLSPLAHGGADEEDLETSFLSLRFSPASTSSIDLQRLLPPFPSPGSTMGVSLFQSSPAPKTPVQTAPTKSCSSSSSLSTTRLSSASRSSGSSSSSSSRELSESFPNIRASTSATPGRNERLKVSSSSVMKMKLHVSFDDFPMSHTKREIEAINNSLKRKKHARKRKLDESKQSQLKTNTKGLNVQRKLLHTPVKEELQVSTESKMEVDSESVRTKPKHAKKFPHGRTAQRKLVIFTDDTKELDREAAQASSVEVPGRSSTVAGTEKAVSANAEAASSAAASSSLRRRLSPTFGSLSAQTLPSTLTNAVQTPCLHPLKLRKSPLSVKTVAAPPVATPVIEKTTPMPSFVALQKPPPAAPVEQVISSATDASQPKPTQPAISTISSEAVKATISLKTPVVKLQPPTATTTLPVSIGPFASNSQILSTPVQPSKPSTAIGTAAPGAAGNPKKVHCNCKKSKCLKLYCECFANGEHCDGLCNCVGCCNTPAHEDVRQQAISSRLEKNPNAFKPKIELTVVTMVPSGVTPSRTIPGFLTPHNDHHPHHARHQHHPLAHGKGDRSGDLKKMHKHGCHCKKSGCQKRYCECFQAGVPCGENCRCIDCKNHSPYAAKNAAVATPLSAISARGPGARGSLAVPPAAPTPDANGDTFVSPTLQSVRQRLRIDRETWARNFSSPFEVSPRRERERTERLRAQLKSSRASALLRSFNAVSTVAPATVPAEVSIKTEPGAATATATPSASSLRVNPAASFASPLGHSQAKGAPRPPRSLSPLSDATRPAPAPTPYGKDARSRHGKRFAPYNPHALEALAINRVTTGRIYVLPLFGDELPPVKTDVSAQIFHFLTNADVYNASLVNRLWSRVTTGDAVWDHHNFRRVPPQHLELATSADVSPQLDDGDVAMQA